MLLLLPNIDAADNLLQAIDDLVWKILYLFRLHQIQLQGSLISDLELKDLSVEDTLL